MNSKRKFRIVRCTVGFDAANAAAEAVKAGIKSGQVRISRSVGDVCFIYASVTAGEYRGARRIAELADREFTSAKLAAMV